MLRFIAAHIKIVLGILLFFSLIIYLALENKDTGQVTVETEINGVIESVSYNEKGFPTISILNKTYYLSFGNVHRFEKGDSLVKSRGSYDTDQYRNGKYIRTHHGYFTTED